MDSFFFVGDGTSRRANGSTGIAGPNSTAGHGGQGHMRSAMCPDECSDMRVEMCADGVCEGMRADACLGTCAGACAGMCAGMCLDVREDVRKGKG